jgi:replication factor A1
VQIKTMEPKAGEAGAVQRFRVVLSDIRNFIQTMVATSTSSVDKARMPLIACSCQ